MPGPRNCCIGGDGRRLGMEVFSDKDYGCHDSSIWVYHGVRLWMVRVQLDTEANDLLVWQRSVFRLSDQNVCFRESSNGRNGLSAFDGCNPLKVDSPI